MTEVTDRPGERGNTRELPTKSLPAVESRDLPEPKKLTAYIGARVILTATAMGPASRFSGPTSPRG